MMRWATKVCGGWVAVVIPMVVSACLHQGADEKASVALREIGPAGKEEVTRPLIVARTLLSGLKEPWGMDFLPDGRLLVTEKSGALQLIDLETLSMQPVAGLPEVASAGQGGLMDVLVHPDFANQPWVFLSYSVAAPGGYSTRVARARFNGSALEAVEELFTAVPFFSERRHFGSRLLLDGDYLYITVGDRGNRDLAQSLDSHNGKVMRVYQDGSVPHDNPFVGQPGALPEIWTYGHRNPQGLARHPYDGSVWLAEHGPQGGDEINRLKAGANYGWPVITYGEEYGGGQIGEGTHKAGMEQPLVYYVPSIGAAGMGFYLANDLTDWPDSLMVAGLKLSRISRLELDADGLGEEVRMLTHMKMRIRDVQQGPDGKVYALADGSRLVRLEP